MNKIAQEAFVDELDKVAKIYRDPGIKWMLEDAGRAIGTKLMSKANKAKKIASKQFNSLSEKGEKHYKSDIRPAVEKARGELTKQLTGRRLETNKKIGIGALGGIGVGGIAGYKLHHKD